jgi:hypothetical protein
MTQSFAQKPPDDPKNRPVQVNFGSETLDLVKKISDLTGRDPGQAISDALGLYEWACSRFRRVGTLQVLAEDVQLSR